MTRMTGPDYAVMCNLINIHTYIHTYPNALDSAIIIMNSAVAIHGLKFLCTVATPPASQNPKYFFLT